jgi:hypothetical protein
MGEHGDKPIEVDPTVGGTEPGEGDAGWAGGGGPASTIDEDASEEEGHLADTDHTVP